MKKRNIYQNRSQELLRLFEDAGSSAKVMCVPMDFAKKDHVVMFCNGYGDIVRKPFSVKNSLEGVKYMVDQVTRSCRHRHIKKKHVFFGGEDVNSYAENFVNASIVIMVITEYVLLHATISFYAWLLLS